ncbi:hypothetical protein CWR48_19145 [Oceanobacillus arenosus]|uniref:Uncharacterized protein n=1 Tax=Oceanobacillus arenosus TaxID=1229153 RepID=A0A3D8PKT5_9BACI|nr:hypothetical protein [Oceanobacillus arenosus]RDW15841.1 hypothetical protein CWR48_19145 [Oceanobacillus arenosus]
MKVKKASSSLSEISYQTPGYITRSDISSMFSHYHSVTVNMNPSIIIPEPGMYRISLKIGNARHLAVASITEPIDLKKHEDRKIRVYIANVSREINDEKVLISWRNLPENMPNQVNEDGLGKVVSL